MKKITTLSLSLFLVLSYPLTSFSNLSLSEKIKFDYLVNEKVMLLDSSGKNGRYLNVAGTNGGRGENANPIHLKMSFNRENQSDLSGVEFSYSHHPINSGNSPSPFVYKIGEEVQSIDLKAKGGHGANAVNGRGGIGGNAGKPGRDATRYRRGTNGGPGGDGSPGGNGGNGGGGGNGGPVTITLPKSDMILLSLLTSESLIQNLHGGEGGNKGTGGAGGEGGLGGRGGSPFTYYDGYVFQTVPGGKRGPKGANGQRGADGINGKRGTDGKFEIRFIQEDGKKSPQIYHERFDLTITEIRTGSHRGFYAPGEIITFNIDVKNSTLMPMPPLNEVVVKIENDQIFKSCQIGIIPKGIEPSESASSTKSIQCQLREDILDYEVNGFKEFDLKFMAHFQNFESLKIPGVNQYRYKIQIKYPIKVEAYFPLDEAMLYEQIPFAVKITNNDPLAPLGIDSESGQTLALIFPREQPSALEPDDTAILSYQDEKGRETPPSHQDQEFRREVTYLPPNASTVIKGFLEFEELTEGNEATHILGKIYLGDAKGLSGVKKKITFISDIDESRKTDFIIVKGPSTPIDLVMKFKQEIESLNQKVQIFNLNRYGTFDFSESYHGDFYLRNAMKEGVILYFNQDYFEFNFENNQTITLQTQNKMSPLEKLNLEYFLNKKFRNNRIKIVSIGEKTFDEIDQGYIFYKEPKKLEYGLPFENVLSLIRELKKTGFKVGDHHKIRRQIKKISPKKEEKLVSHLKRELGKLYPNGRFLFIKESKGISSNETDNRTPSASIETLILVRLTDYNERPLWHIRANLNKENLGDVDIRKIIFKFISFKEKIKIINKKLNNHLDQVIFDYLLEILINDLFQEISSLSHSPCFKGLSKKEIDESLIYLDLMLGEKHSFDKAFLSKESFKESSTRVQFYFNIYYQFKLMVSKAKSVGKSITRNKEQNLHFAALKKLESFIHQKITTLETKDQSHFEKRFKIVKKEAKKEIEMQFRTNKMKQKEMIQFIKDTEKRYNQVFNLVPDQFIEISLKEYLNYFKRFHQLKNEKREISPYCLMENPELRKRWIHHLEESISN